MDRIYLTAHEHAPAHTDINTRVADLLRDYSFDVFIPPEESSPHGTYPELATPLDFSKMMIMIFHGPEATPRMTFEMAEASHRRMPMIALSTVPVGELPPALSERFVKVIAVPDDPDELLHPLMTAINRHFPV